MNKYRISFMIVLIIMLFLYFIGYIEVSEETNFAFTFSALVLSISMALDTYAKKNVIIESLRFILEVLSLLIVVIIPNLKDVTVLKHIMKVFDSNVLLILALFFTFAGQWATEIKIREIQRRKE